MPSSHAELLRFAVRLAPSPVDKVLGRARWGAGNRIRQVQQAGLDVQPEVVTERCVHHGIDDSHQDMDASHMNHEAFLAEESKIIATDEPTELPKLATTSERRPVEAQAEQVQDIATADIGRPQVHLYVDTRKHERRGVLSLTARLCGRSVSLADLVEVTLPETVAEEPEVQQQEEEGDKAKGIPHHSQGGKEHLIKKRRGSELISVKSIGHRSAGYAGACEDGARGETRGGVATLTLTRSTCTIEVLSIDDIGIRDKDQLPARMGLHSPTESAWPFAPHAARSELTFAAQPPTLPHVFVSSYGPHSHSPHTNDTCVLEVVADSAAGGNPRRPRLRMERSGAPPVVIGLIKPISGMKSPFWPQPVHRLVTSL